MITMLINLCILLMSTAAIEHVNDDKMEIYYINLKSSTDRAESMRRHLDHFSYPHFRVDAVTYGIYKGANLTDNIHPCELKHEPFIFETNFGSFNKIQIDRLCIAQRNEIKEVVVTLSHIKAIYLAVMSPSTHPYAYIMEDDLQIQFDVDFDALIKLFPPDFGIIQTFVINHIAASGFIKFYEKKHLDYVTWKPPYWSAGGYIVNKKVIFNELKELFSQTGDTFHIDLIAGSDRLNPIFMQKWPKVKTEPGCFPKECCDGLEFIKKHPCVMSKDIAADYYVYNIVYDKSYTTTIPLLKGAPESYNSTIADVHNDEGERGLDKIEALIRGIYKGYIPCPPYLKLRPDLVEYYSHWTKPVRPTKPPSVWDIF